MARWSYIGLRLGFERQSAQEDLLLPLSAFSEARRKEILAMLPAGAVDVLAQPQDQDNPNAGELLALLFRLVRVPAQQFDLRGAADVSPTLGQVFVERTQFRMRWNALLYQWVTTLGLQRVNRVTDEYGATWGILTTDIEDRRRDNEAAGRRFIILVCEEV